MKFYFIKKHNGIAAMETSLALPIICYLMFFIFEVMKMNSIQTAIDSMAIEIAFDFMASKNTDNFEEIIEKHKPPYISNNDISWYFDIYDNISVMNDKPPYGGGEVYWPASESGGASSGDYIESDGKEGLLLKNNDDLPLQNYKHPEGSFGVDKIGSFKSLSGKSFVLTVVCDYHFSSSFVGKLFNGGANTKSKKKFIVWGRCVGVCS